MKKPMLRFLQRLNLLRLINTYYSYSIGSARYSIPVQQGTGMEMMMNNEPWMFQVLNRMVPLFKGKLYVDVGVNIGQTLLKLKAVDPAMHYIGFEPNPLCAAYVNQLVRRNQLSRVSILPVALAARTAIQILTLYSEDGADSAASLIDNFRTDEQKQKIFVPSFTPEDIMHSMELPTIGCIKIDVEGAEWEVLQGLKNRLLSDRPIIQMEILPVYKPENSGRLERQQLIERLLQELDYTLCVIGLNSKQDFTALRKISSIGIHSDLSRCEYLAFPKEREADIQDIMGGIYEH